MSQIHFQYWGKKYVTLIEKVFFCFICLFLLLLALSTSAAEQKDFKRFRFELEGGPAWQSKNDVQIPGNTGTEFSFKDLTGVRLILRDKLFKNRVFYIFILTLCDKHSIYCHIWKQKVSHLL